ncbi:serine/threonine-protein kinase [Antrihabitans cavernicola]|uniref:non-specific serine/threonine protein kinase n=1 Tax=Antrihabitans cavernicola TaxID=2495913 RepID=A0A5A7S4C2_9NOCA|nr:serine/threonine-protein kinase [Spelaeibacter cavernicola]KAA0018055.1 serine/threonine protein kinase [Spelaeibacter cavernicola]
MALLPGTVFAGYTIERRLGAGGMGAVYLARHPRLPRRDALKVLDDSLGSDHAFRARFEREAELASRLDHPNIVSIYDRGSEGSQLWISMQYVDGVDVSALVKQGPAALPPERVSYIIGEAARGLDSAHRRGLLHRDVKPANILVARSDDDHDKVLVTDFGIARSLDESVALTATGSLVATLAYAAPEQIEGKQVDHRVDIYALGCTLYEMLTGSVPFRRESPVAVMHAHLSSPPPRATLTSPGVPPEIDDVIAKAMAKDPAQRFGSCRELAEAAATALRSPVDRGRVAPTLVRGPTTTAVNQALVPPVQRRRAPKIVGAGLALALVAALVVVIVKVTSGSDSSAAPPTPVPGPVASSAVATTAALETTTAEMTTAPPASSAAPIPAPATGAWGDASYIVDAFPNLLPATPNSTGYQGISCAPLNSENGSTARQLHCPADGNGISVNVWCDPARSQQTYTASGDGVTDVHEERWTRPSGTGSVRWETDSMSGSGLLSVSFDDPGRDFCVLGASGGSSGQDVHDNWFLAAPF